MMSPVQVRTCDLESCTNKSIDSTILNSPSSLHRLQTLTRKQRTPLGSTRSTAEVHRLDSIDLNATSPDSVSAVTGAGILSNSSSMLYLSDCCLTDVAASSVSEQIMKDKRCLYGDNHNHLNGRSSTPFSSSTSTRHSIAYYLAIPRLDQFLSWTQLIFQLAFYILPMVWIFSAIGWIVYLRKRNKVWRDQLQIGDSEVLLTNEETTDFIDDQTSDTKGGDNSSTMVEHSIAAALTLLAVLLTVAFACIYVIKSNWAYSFEFVPNEEESTSDFESTTITQAAFSDISSHQYKSESEVIIAKDIHSSSDNLVNVINQCTDSVRV